MREFWLSPKTVGFAVPLIIASALQIGGWVNPAVAYTLFAVSFAWLVIALRHWRRHKRESQQLHMPASSPATPGLTDTLTAMHRRLAELQLRKASRTKIPYAVWQKAVPSLADTMGLVRLRDWPRFERTVESRLRRALPRKNFERILDPRKRFLARARWRARAELVAIALASDLKAEYLKSADWTMDDVMKATNWLDAHNWGVRRLRDEDPQWQGLFQAVSTHLKDDALRDMIKRHIDLSLVCNNTRLAIHYSGQYKHDVVSIMLHGALMDSPVSPDDVEIALSAILSDIEQALTRTSSQPRIVIGGFAGGADGVTMRHCTSQCKITVAADSEDVRVGGFIGEGHDVQIVDSFADVEVEYRQTQASQPDSPEHTNSP